MNDRQKIDKGQETSAEVIVQSVADRLQTALIAAGLLFYISASVWGMARAGFRPCSLGDCVVSPGYQPSGMIDTMNSSSLTRTTFRVQQ